MHAQFAHAMHARVNADAQETRIGDARLGVDDGARTRDLQDHNLAL
ncbi:MAG: hypothetical protein RLZZ327_612 [Actinomycetota bacterium]|jgi:hypothetical protein